MKRQQRQTSAGGFFVAMLTIGGAVIGGLLGQPSIGLLSGLALGVAIALVIWWRDKARHDGAGS